MSINLLPALLSHECLHCLNLESALEATMLQLRRNSFALQDISKTKIRQGPINQFFGIYVGY